jgi:hypothetical protein
MDSDHQSVTALRTASEAEAAEETFSRQREDHTLPAGQVFGEQCISAASGLANAVFVP